MNELKYLDWDSNFFEFKVGLLVIDGPIKSLNTHLEKYQKDGYRLIYMISSKRVNHTLLNNNYKECFLVDEKITYTKKLKKNTSINSRVSKYVDNISDEILIELAIQSGIYSRFNVDKNIENKRFKELYSIWMVNSINKVMAKEVYVIDKTNVKGVITLRERHKRADIGLIAVDAGSRGEGLGEQLLIAGENWGLNQGYEFIQVVTQKQNKIACSFYERNGYNQEKKQFVYHVWFNK